MNRDKENERPMPADQESPIVSEAKEGVQGDGVVAAPGDPKAGTTDVQAYIGRQLRAVYDDVVKQPIPERFLALMAQLDGKTPGG